MTYFIFNILAWNFKLRHFFIIMCFVMFISTTWCLNGFLSENRQ